MSTKGTTRILKGLTLLLTLLLVGLGIYTYRFYKDVQISEAQLEKEKNQIREELENEIAKYNEVLAQKNDLTTELENAKTRLELLSEEVQKNRVSQRDIDNYRSELRKLRNERVLLFRQNDSLVVVNERLEALQEETQQSLDSVEEEKNRLLRENLALANQVAKAALITASNIQSRGVIQHNSGRLRVTQRARRTEMIHVRYDVNENNLAIAADLPFYTQVLDDKGNLIGTKREISFSDGTTILFNTRTIVPYKKTSFKVSELILPIQQFEPGTYTINVYLGSRLVLSDMLALK